MPSGSLEVVVVEAKGIKDTELFGKSDPYAILTCGQIKLRTFTAKDQGSHPVWNQKLVFNIDEGISQLTVRIYNENVLQDDELGSVIIPLAKVFSNGKVPLTSYYVVRPSGRTQGEVKLEMNFTTKGSYGKHSDALGDGAGCHGDAHPHVPYGGVGSYGIESFKHGNEQQPMGVYPPHNYSFYTSNPYPSSQYPCPSPMLQSSEQSHTAAFPGYPPPVNMALPYPSSSYPPPPPNPYNPQQSYPAGYSRHPTVANTYAPPPSQFGGNTGPDSRKTVHESYPDAPHSAPLDADIPVKKMEKLSLAKKPSNDDATTFSSPPYPLTEYGVSGEKQNKTKPGETYPPYGYSGAEQSVAGSYPQATCPAGRIDLEKPGKDDKEKNQSSFAGFQTANQQESYPPVGYTTVTRVDGYGKPGKENNQGNIDGSQTAHLQEPYLAGGNQNPIYVYSREGEYLAATGYSSSGYHAAGSSFELGKPGKERTHGSFDGPPTAYPHETYSGECTHKPAYVYSAAGENPNTCNQVALHSPRKTSFESGKPGKEKKQGSLDGSQAAYSQATSPGGSPENSKYGYPSPGLSPIVGYPPSGYPTTGRPIESGKPGKEITQGNFDGPTQTGYPQEPYAGGSLYSTPGGYPVSGGQYRRMHDDGKLGKNKEESEHGSIDGHYDKHSAYPQASYQVSSFHNAPIRYNVMGDDHRKKHVKDKEEKKYEKFEDHYGLHTGYPPTPYMGGSSHYAPDGYPISGGHYEGKHGKYKEEKHGKHGNHGKHGKSKGFKRKW